MKITIRKKNSPVSGTEYYTATVSQDGQRISVEGRLSDHYIMGNGFKGPEIVIGSRGQGRYVDMHWDEGREEIKKYVKLKAERELLDWLAVDDNDPIWDRVAEIDDNLAEM